MLPALFSKTPCSLPEVVSREVARYTHACLEVRFGFKKKIGSLSEGSTGTFQNPYYDLS